MTYPPAIIVIAGPTASGKSEFAVKIARKIGGEIISADSRQVYRGLNIGTGKVEGRWVPVPLPSREGLGPAPYLIRGEGEQRQKEIFIYRGIPHHCIDFVSPKKQYTVADFKRDGQKAIKDIISRGKTPIICGGTGHYIDALVFNQNIPDVPPNMVFRKKMENKTAEELFKLLEVKDPARASNIDRHNKRRLIRALEIIQHTGKSVPILLFPDHLSLRATLWGRGNLNFDNAQSALDCFVPEPPRNDRSVVQVQGAYFNSHPIHFLYLHLPREELYKKIETRLKQRVQAGMVDEIKKLHEKGLSWKRLEDLGLEYRYVSLYFMSLRGAERRSNLAQDNRTSRLFLSSPYYQQLLTEIKHYAKKQETWFRKYNYRHHIFSPH